MDDYSRAVWIYLLVDKTEVFHMFMRFVSMVDRQFSQTIKIVQSDNGTEFNCLHDYFVANGIIFQTSCVGTPQQNGRVERKHKHILNVGRALRFQSTSLFIFGENVYWLLCILLIEPHHLFCKIKHPMNCFMALNPPTILYVHLVVFVLPTTNKHRATNLLVVVEKLHFCGLSFW